MEFNLAPEERPTLGEWAKGNGYIVKESLKQLYRFNGGSALKQLQPHFAKVYWGPTIWDYDWDLCILLDTCRPDALQEVAPEYDWLPDTIGSTRSASSWSKHWYIKTFDERFSDELAETGLVSWNTFTDGHVDGESLAYLDEVWRYGWDDDNGLVPPRSVTDRAIHAARTQDADRYVVHYMQPHAPYREIETEQLRADQIGDIHTNRRTVWDRLIDTSDELSVSEVWGAMLNNLRWALDDVELLLENVDAPRVLLTADHGEMFGRWGVYGHGPGMPFLSLLRVPEVWLSATDTGSYQPEIEPQPKGEITSDVADERLAALGYK